MAMDRSMHHYFPRFLLLWLLAVSALSQASPQGTARDKHNDAVSGRPSVSRTLKKFGEHEAILCLYVRKVDVMLEDKTTSINTYNCLLDPRHTDGAKGLEAVIEGAGDEFAKAREAALLEDKPSLYIVGGILSEGKGSLTFQDDDSTKSSLVWEEAVDKDVLPAKKPESYRVAGSYTALIVRITATDDAASTTALSLYNANFLLSGVSTASQYLGCSGNMVEFIPASGTTPGGQNITDGVVEVSVSLSASGNTPLDLTNEAAITLGGADQLKATYDHVLFAIPYGTTFGGSTWVAFAEKPGTFSWYSDYFIFFFFAYNYATAVDVTVHEVGHNYNLAHSNDIYSEYGDYTCMMGASIGDLKCFNGAKMAQLEWFEERTKTVDPLEEAFSGYLIGVNDYPTSLEEHNIVLILDEGVKDFQYYLTYNREEGITADTAEAYNEVLIVTTVPWGEFSYLNASLSVGETYSIEDYAGSGRTLVISVEEMIAVTGSDGLDTIDVANLTIAFQDVQCVTDADCDDSNDCTIDVCGAASICEYSSIDDCCGNGFCELEAGESCSTCKIDCSGDDCSILDLGTGFRYFDDDSAGMMFDIDALTDIYVYELSFELISADGPLTNATISIYTKEGSYVGSESSAEDWDLVADSITVQGTGTGIVFGEIESYGFSVPLLDSTIWSSTKRAFYITAEVSTGVYFICSTDDGVSPDTVSHENSDIILYHGLRMGYEFLPSNISNVMAGTIYYGYGATSTAAPVQTLPTSAPNMSPTAAPTDSGAAPSTSPTDSGAAPSTSPTDSGAAPSISPTDSGAAPSISPTDSGAPPSISPTDVSAPPSTSPNALATSSPSSLPSDSPTRKPSLVKIKLRNRQFENDTDEWKIVTGTPERICNTGNEYSGECCYAFIGSSSGEVQRIKNKVRDYEGGGQIGDKFQLSFWLKGEDVVKKRDFRIYLKLKGGEAGSRNLFCKSSKKGTFDYKKMLCEYEAEVSFEAMDIIFEYQGTVGAVYLDRLTLYEVVMNVEE